MTTGNRPLSPHLQVYKLPLSGLMSISHRITGVALSVGTLVFAYWIMSAAYGPEAFATAQAFIGSWFGKLLVFGWTFCLYYHLCNGLRHLVWDAAKGLEIELLKSTGKLVIAAAAILTLLTWVAAYAA